MMDFKKRTYDAEAMDDLSLPETELKRALADISRVNRYLGGHRSSIEALKPYLYRHKEPLCILDIGCGNGEFLRYLARFCRKHGYEVRLIGWDINPRSVASAAALAAEFPEISIEEKNILDFPELPGHNTVVICNLFLHHFRESEIKKLLDTWLDDTCKAIVINDLHRNKLAYYLFRLFGAIFMKSEVARSDGAISIRRGFLRAELQDFSDQLSVNSYSIRWKWAFRYLWVLEGRKK